MSNLQRVVRPETGIQHQEDNCKLHIDRTEFGIGTLYISEDRLIWENADNRGLSLAYKDIAIHAISKDLQTFPEECLYVMYNGKAVHDVSNGMNGNNQENAEDSAEEDDTNDRESEISEIRFIPQCKDNLKMMFDSMSDCQCLHPDDEDSDGYNEGGAGDNGAMQGVHPPVIYNDGGAGEGFYTTEEGFEHLTPSGQATLARLENMLAASEANVEIPYPQMEGVRIEDEEDMPVEETPTVGRTANSQSNRTDDNAPIVEGQFDDVE